MNRPESESGSHAVPADHTSARSADGSGTRREPALAGGLPAALGGYRIDGLLGNGGMGFVYRAHDVRADRPVALKTMRPELVSQPGAVDRFLREARAAAKVRHDNVIEIWQVGEDAGVPFIAMPVLDGEPLNDWLAREPVPPLGVTLKVGRETADGLAAAHARGLVHRDIKPANLWIEGDRGSDDLGKRFRRVKVLDFGLARPAEGDTQLTGTGGVLGTPAYMSPEQARGDRIDHRSDLFSLGVVLYRMTTGAAPFAGASVMAVLTSLAVATPPPPRDLNPDLPPALSELITRLLEKEPDKRPASAAEVAAALREIAKQRKAAPAPSAPAAAPDGIPMAASVSQSLPVVVYPQPLAQPESAVRPDHNPFTQLHPTELPAPSGEVAKPAPRPERPARAARTSRGVWVAVAGACLLAVAGAVAAVKFLQKKPDPAPDETAKDAPKPKEPPPKPKDNAKVTDPDRAAAEWLLSAGGTVVIKDATSRREIKTKADVPAGPFAVVVVLAHGMGAKFLDADLARFKDCAELETVNANQTNLTGDGLAPFANHPTLSALYLDATLLGNPATAHLKSFPRLRHLHLAGTNVGDAAVPNLKVLPKLIHLTLKNTGVTESKIRELAKALPQCVIEWDGVTIVPGAGDRAAALWALSVGGKVSIHHDNTPNYNALRAEDLPPGPIVLTKVNVTGKGFADDAGLAKLKGLSALTYLTVAGSPITDAGLAHLRDLPALQTLDLKNTPITDAGLEHLATLTNLTVLFATGTNVSKQGVEKLSKALPKCRIVWNGGTVQTQGSNRAVAEWVLSLGGAVRLVNRSEVQIRQLKDLPDGPLVFVKEIDLGTTDNIDDADFLRLGGLIGLTHVYVASNSLTDAALAHLKNMKDLAELGVTSPKITDAGLAHLAGLNLQTVFLGGTQVTDAGLAHLKNMSKMNTLRLEKTKVTGPGLEHLQNLKALSHLILTDTPLTDEGLKYLALLPRLELLDLKGTKVTAEGVAILQQALPKCKINSDAGKNPIDNRAVAEWALANGGSLTLRQRDGTPQHVNAKNFPKEGAVVILRLDLGACKEATDENLAKLRGLHELTQIHLSATPITGAALANLKGLQRLTRVYVNGTRVGDDGAAHLGAMPWLEHLDLGGTEITDDGLKHIGKLKNLTQLTLPGKNTTDAGLAHIAPLTELEWLGLHSTRTTDDGLRHLKQMTKLTLLGLQATRVTGTGLEHLAACPLKTLELTHLGGKPLELARLDKVPGLRHLDLDVSWVTDAQLAHLAHLKNLESLRLSHTKIGDAGLKHLKGLPKLTSLSLEGTGVTDGGADALKDLTALTVLGLSGTKVSAAGVEKLKAALPNCKVLGPKP